MKRTGTAEVAYIGLGSNLQDRLAHLRTACQELVTVFGIERLTCSTFYQTEPMGPSDQPDYLNAVCRIETHLAPLALLDELQTIEAAHGRVRIGARWTARPLDLDLLLYGDQVIDNDRLQVPHPGIALRSFVLKPLLDLDPDLCVPGAGPVRVLLESVDSLGIQPFPE